MPWRTNTLTEFKTTTSPLDDVSDEGLGRHGERLNAENFGIDSLDDDLNGSEHAGSVCDESCMDFDLTG